MEPMHLQMILQISAQKQLQYNLHYHIFITIPNQA